MSDQKFRAVLVDDSADIRTLIRLRLETTGRFEVIAEGGDGLVAIELARAHQPDVMVIDVSMPLMDGIDALPEIKAAAPNTVVAMFTGFQTDELEAQARHRGAAAVFQKGASIGNLPQSLLSLLGDREPARAGAAAPASEEEQSQLAEHLERFREIFDNAAIGMATLTLSGRIARANEAASHLLRDGSEEPIVGRNYCEFVAESLRPTVRAAIEAVASGSRLETLEHSMVKSGRIASVSIASIADSHSRPLYLYLQVQDVTQLRLAEGRARATEERLRLLIDSVVDYAIFVLDPEGNITSWNPGAERIKGWTEEEIIGQNFRVFYPPEAQAAKHPEYELKIAVQKGRYEEVGWRVRKDGSRFWANVVITPLYEAGELVGFGKVTRDVGSRPPSIISGPDGDFGTAEAAGA